MTTPTSLHEPVVAFGKTNEKTGVVATVTEGSQAFAFTNTGGGRIHVGDIVMCSDESDDDNQYLGEVLTQTDAGVTTELVLQNAPGTSLKIWEPTTRVRFQWGQAIGGQLHIEDDGTTTLLTRGNTAIPVQTRDSSKIFEFAFNPVAPGDYELWRAFRQSDRSFGTDLFALIFYDEIKQISRSIEVRLASGPTHTTTVVGKVISAFSERFFEVDDDKYTLT